MYSWGDGMEDWARPDAYKFDDARKAARDADAAAAASKGPRTYQKTKQPGKLADPRKTIRTTSAVPIVVAVDVTGSMSTWPAEIFDRLPLLYQTLSQYKPDIEVAFAAVGDATCDRFPLQVTDFAKGIALEDSLAALHGEGGGGGGARESYELLGAYLKHRVRVPEGVRPTLILYGDEGFYPAVDARQAKHVFGMAVEEPSALDVWRDLAERWDVWHLRKRYDSASHDREILAQWTGALGAQRIVHLDDPYRAVDYALGLIARLWGHFEDFKVNMRARQSDAKVEVLANSVLAIEPVPPTRRSA